MLHFTKWLPATALISTLAACSGGGGSASFEDLSEERLALSEALEEMDRTPDADMPTSGFARYAGVAGFSIGAVPQDAEDLNILSDLALTADFSNSEISGTISNFESAERDDFDGELRVENGQITDNTFTADAGGTLTRNGADLAVDLGLDGAFGGDDAGLVAGTADGTAGDEAVYGAFTAQ